MKSLAPAASFAAHADSRREPTLHNRPCTHGVTMTGVNERVYSSKCTGGGWATSNYDKTGGLHSPCAVRQDAYPLPLEFPDFNLDQIAIIALNY